VTAPQREEGAQAPSGAPFFARGFLAILTGRGLNAPADPDPTWPVRVPVSFTDATGNTGSTTLEIAASEDAVQSGLSWARDAALAPLSSVWVNGTEVLNPSTKVSAR
jgi:hypothetical protein